MAFAVEPGAGGAPIPITPGTGPVTVTSAARSGTPPIVRNVASSEVDIVVMRIGADGTISPDDLARWAQLAAKGYRISNIGGDGTRSILYVERPFSPNMGHSIRLPAVIEANPTQANQLRQQLMSEVQGRLQDQQSKAGVGTPVPVERSSAPPVPASK